MLGRCFASIVSAAVIAAALVLVEPVTFVGVHDAVAGGDWNDSGIDWKGYEEGLALAAETGKPVCLIFYTDWCPHCTNYSGVFHDEKVVAMAKKFVMVRINRDKNRELSAKYAPDGEYIPRTYFLSPKGELWTSVHAARAQFQYFYDERNPASLLEGMRSALGRLGKG